MLFYIVFVVVVVVASFKTNDFETNTTGMHVQIEGCISGSSF